MIRGVHAMFYTSEAEALREFIRDKLGFPYVDVGDGWLIFNPGEAEIGCHPETGSARHDISFYCDDIEATIAEMKSKGVEFAGEIEDHGYGLVTYFKAPGDLTIQLYQRKY